MVARGRMTVLAKRCIASACVCINMPGSGISMITLSLQLAKMLFPAYLEKRIDESGYPALDLKDKTLSARIIERK
jgi:hypothetical protein